MKLEFDWFEADMLLSFLEENKKEFIEFGEEFGWKPSRAKKLHKKLYNYTAAHWQKLTEDYDKN